MFLSYGAMHLLGPGICCKDYDKNVKTLIRCDKYIYHWYSPQDSEPASYFTGVAQIDCMKSKENKGTLGLELVRTLDNFDIQLFWPSFNLLSFCV